MQNRRKGKLDCKDDQNRKIMSRWKQRQPRASSSVYQPTWPLVPVKDNALLGLPAESDKENIFIGNFIQNVEIDRSDMNRERCDKSGRIGKGEIGGCEDIFVSRLSSIKGKESPERNDGSGLVGRERGGRFAVKKGC